MPKEIQVSYMMQVSCFVDVDSGEVVEVIAYKANVDLAGGECYDADCNPLGPEAEDDRARALEIVETEPWPVWSTEY